MPDLSNGPQKNITVSILGEDYIVSGGSEEYMREVARIVDERVQDFLKAHPKLPVSKVAVLVALNFADEFQRLKVKHEEILRKTSGKR
ncbi:MAG TPA: cell division protein ZapA [Firmicutes bacterium]|nr:cell division protein ZapA [Bacillota bacterium]HAW70917.1 cell division protein ZapA [Bacillota bacterium]HAZ21151.1 cell division protein ZapA [Bacillota bacterium]HBE07075.1 cell division protein ZapA [Bacillota bacterium]HBG42942.1 cell division protein ZapA [Bacillota bacterium]